MIGASGGTSARLAGGGLLPAAWMTSFRATSRLCHEPVGNESHELGEQPFHARKNDLGSPEG